MDIFKWFLHFTFTLIALNWTDLMWNDRLPFCVNVDWQILQSYVSPSWTDLSWRLRCDECEYSLSQELHWYIFPLCFVWICLLRLPLNDALKPHIVHWYFKPWWTDFLCVLFYSVVMLDNHIMCRCISFVYELIWYVYSCFLDL